MKNQQKLMYKRFIFTHFWTDESTQHTVALVQAINQPLHI